ncbi:MAG: nucleotidyltransferase family protein [Deltaproteobacteria bacterium]|nr:nucleotidyltransferase family protein [Deltaproteobacteria bacterium]
MHHSNEIKLLLNCLKAEPDDKNIETVLSLVSKKLDWQKVIRIAEQNDILSLFFYNIKQICHESAFPSDVFKDLSKRYHAINYQNIRYLQELKEIMILLGNAGIDAIALKGASLIESVWENAALRQMADIDILIRKQDISKAEQLLSDSGYVAHEGYRPKEWYREHHFHVAPYLHPKRKIPIEIHHNFISADSRIHLDMDQVWRHAEINTNREISTKRLSREDMFIHLCLHIHSTCVGTIKYLSDIARFLKYYKGNIDWDIIEKKAKDKELIHCIYYSLYAANVFLAASIDKQIIHRFQRKSSRHFWAHFLIIKMIKNDIVFDYEDYFFPEYYHAKLFKEIFMETPLKEKMISIMEFLFPGTDLSPHNVRDRFPLRPNRLAFYGHRIFHLLLKSLNSNK